MFGKMRSSRRKRGAAMAELCIAIALLSIVSTMIVSFSAIVNDFVTSEQNQYDFLEETSDLHEELRDWMTESDSAGAVYTVRANSITVSGSVAAVKVDAFASRVYFTYPDGTVTIMEPANMDSVQFIRSGDNSLVKCYVIGSDERNNMFEESFILSLQCGSYAG